MHPMADQILIERYRAGDRDALERLIRRWNTEVLSLAYRLTADHEDALDIRQQSFLKMYRALPSFRSHSRFSTWLYRIVVNTCRDHIRSRETRSRLMAASREGASPSDQWDMPSHDEIHEQQELNRRVVDAIRTLSASEREVIVLRHYQQIPFREIAVVVGAPVTTVRSRMLRALKHLRNELASLDDSAPAETTKTKQEGG